jgi:WXG100 family type VII secretion target
VGDELRVDTARLHGVAQQVRATGQDLGEELRKVRFAIDEIRANWYGPSAGRFEELLSQWGHDVHGLLAALGAIADLLDRSAGTYAEAQAEQRQQMGQVTAFESFGPVLNPQPPNPQPPNPQPPNPQPPAPDGEP